MGRKRPYSLSEEDRAMDARLSPVHQRHITIVRKGFFPVLQPCTSCCRLVHCPFCKESVYKPKFMYHVKRHIQIHLKYGVHYEDYIICRCNLDCRKVAHFHCLWCSKTILRKDDFQNHLTVCQERSHPVQLGLSDPYRHPASPVLLSIPPPGAVLLRLENHDLKLPE